MIGECVFVFCVSLRRRSRAEMKVFSLPARWKFTAACDLCTHAFRAEIETHPPGLKNAGGASII